MNLSKMKYFADIVKYNSFTKAAQANYISQTAISQQIASMETELGVKLLERNKKGLVITEAGQSFYDSCLRILSLYMRSVSLARCIDQGLSGNIMLGLTYGIDSSYVYSAISELVKRFSDVRIAIRLAPPSELMYMFKASALNIAISIPYEFDQIPDVAITPLASCGYNLFVSRDNPLAALNEVSINDIQGERFAVPHKSVGELTYSHLVTEHMQINHGLMPRLFSPNFESTKMMVATNQCVAILPEYSQSMDSIRIKRLRLLDYTEMVPFSLIWRPGISSPGLVEFVEILKKHFGQLSGR